MPTTNNDTPSPPDINTISPDDARQLGQDYPVPEDNMRNFSFLACPPGRDTESSTIASAVRKHQTEMADRTHMFYGPNRYMLPFTVGPEKTGVFLDPDNTYLKRYVYTSGRRNHGVRNPSGTGNSRAVRDIFQHCNPYVAANERDRNFGYVNMRGVTSFPTCNYIAADTGESPDYIKKHYDCGARLGNLSWSRMHVSYLEWKDHNFDPEYIPDMDRAVLTIREPSNELPNYSLVPASRLYKILLDNQHDAVEQLRQFKQLGVALVASSGRPFSSESWPWVGDPEVLEAVEVDKTRQHPDRIDGLEIVRGETMLQFLWHRKVVGNGTYPNKFQRETYNVHIEGTLSYKMYQAHGLSTHVRNTSAIAIFKRSGSTIDTAPHDFHVAHQHTPGLTDSATEQTTVALPDGSFIKFYSLTADAEELTRDHTHNCVVCGHQYVQFSSSPSRCPSCNHDPNRPHPSLIVGGWRGGPRNLIKDRWDESIDHPLIKYTIGFEVEKNGCSYKGNEVRRSGAQLPELVPFLPCWETDASCGLEAISHTYSLGDPGPFYEDVNASRDALDNIPADSRCGGHLSVMGPEISKHSIRHYAGLLYSLYYGRIGNSYCNSNFKTRENTRKYSMIKFRDHNFVEFRLFSAVKSADQVLWRYLLMQRFMLAVHEGWEFQRLVDHCRPLLRQVYKPSRARVIVARANKFERYLNHGEVHQDIEDLVIFSNKEEASGSVYNR